MTRMIDLRGMSHDEALHRINSQATNTERLAIADVVIDSNGTLEQTLDAGRCAVGEALSACRRPDLG